MSSFKRRTKGGRIAIVRRSSRGGTFLGIAVGHRNVKKAIESGKAGSLKKADMAKAFDVYKKGSPGLLEKYGIIPNRKTQNNPYR